MKTDVPIEADGERQLRLDERNLVLDRRLQRRIARRSRRRRWRWRWSCWL
jgi:hypothetical protein